MRRCCVFVMACASLGGVVFAQPDKPAAAPQTQPAPKPEKAPEAPAKSAEPTIKVLDAGQAEGKRELRLKPKVGMKSRYVMTSKTGIALNMNGQDVEEAPVPAAQFTVETVVDAIDGDGLIRATSVFTEVKTVKTEGVSDQAMEMMEQTLAIVRGMKAKVVMTDRGVVRSWTFEGVDDNPMMKMMVESMTQSAQQMAVPLPKEAVGVGAKWESHAEPEMMGLKQTLEATYTLESMTGDTAKLKLEIKQEAKEQEMKNEMLPPGASAKVKSMLGKGTGTIELVLTEVTPSDMSMNTKTDMELVMKMNGEEITMKQKLKMDVTMKALREEEKPAAAEKGKDAKPAATPKADAPKK